MKPGEVPLLQAHERYQLNVIAMMVRKLGGEVVINNKEMQDLWNSNAYCRQIYDPVDSTWMWTTKEGEQS